MTTMTEPVTPWYRQAWPWFLISLPATAVVAGSITFYLAAKGWDGPVTSDYYKQGLAINQELNRSARAKELGIDAVVKLAGLGVGERVRVELRAEQQLPADTALRVRLAHPGKRDGDRLAVLSRSDVSADGRTAVYSGEWQQGEPDDRMSKHPVAWQAIVETPQWRIDGSFTAGAAGEFSLSAR